LPPALADWIQARGHEAVHVSDVGLAAASDDAIWWFANAGGFVIVTKDEDFAERRGREAGPSILWLRLGNATSHTLLARMARIWDDVLNWLKDGEAIVEA
jgi:predicted nuclease of predicted toxin-antitoxin system